MTFEDRYETLKFSLRRQDYSDTIDRLRKANSLLTRVVNADSPADIDLLQEAISTSAKHQSTMWLDTYETVPPPVVSHWMTPHKIDSASIFNPSFADFSFLKDPISEKADLQDEVNFVARMLTDNSELLSLYQDAIHHIGEESFLKENRRLLGRYFLALSNDAPSLSQRVAAQLLGSQKKRDSISEIGRLLVYMGHLDTSSRTRYRLNQIEKAIAKVFLDGDRAVQRTIEDDIFVESERVQSDKDVENDDTGDEDYVNSNSSAETADSFVPGNAFRKYKESLRLLIHPANPKTDVPGVQSVPTVGTSIPDSEYEVLLHRENICSFGERCKKGFERFVGCQLAWWPLEQPEDVLRSDHIRVYSMPVVSLISHQSSFKIAIVLNLIYV